MSVWIAKSIRMEISKLIFFSRTSHKSNITRQQMARSSVSIGLFATLIEFNVNRMFVPQVIPIERFGFVLWWYWRFFLGSKLANIQSTIYSSTGTRNVCIAAGNQYACEWMGSCLLMKATKPISSIDIWFVGHRIVRSSAVQTLHHPTRFAYWMLYVCANLWVTHSLFS